MHGVIPTCLITASRQDRLALLQRVLEREYRVLVAENWWHAMELMDERVIDLIVFDPHVPGPPGARSVQLAQHAKERFGGKCPVVFHYAGSNEAIENAIRKATHHRSIDRSVSRLTSDAELITAIWHEVDKRLEEKWDALPPAPRHLLKFARTAIDDISVAVQSGGMLPTHLFDQVADAIVDVISEDQVASLLDTLHEHHDHTFTHTLHVAILMSVFGNAVGTGSSDTFLLAEAGLMHDIGKLRIPPEILNKPTLLTPEERTVIETHPRLGWDVLSKAPSIPGEVKHAALWHHERMDGTGYPDRLNGSRIPDVAAMCAIADVFSALTDKRAYKAPYSRDRALEIMGEMAGSSLEEGLFEAFKGVVVDSYEIALQHE